MAGGHAWWVAGGVHGRGACVAGGACVVGGMHGGSVHRGVHDMHAPPGQILRLWHTVNERAVRILLECILVLNRVFHNLSTIYKNANIGNFVLAVPFKI